MIIEKRKLMARGAVPKSEVDLAISKNVRAFREALGISQAELATQMALNPAFTAFNATTISKIELVDIGANQRRVSAAECAELARILHTTSDALMAPTINGSEAFRDAVARGEDLNKTLRALIQTAGGVLDDAREFDRAHAALMKTGELDSSATDAGYARLVSNLDSELIDALKVIQRRGGRSWAALSRFNGIVGEYTSPDGREIGFQASTAVALWQWENSNKDDVFRQYVTTGESPIENLYFLD